MHVPKGHARSTRAVSGRSWALGPLGAFLRFLGVFLGRRKVLLQPSRPFAGFPEAVLGRPVLLSSRLGFFLGCIGALLGFSQPFLGAAVLPRAAVLEWIGAVLDQNGAVSLRGAVVLDKNGASWDSLGVFVAVLGPLAFQGAAVLE